MPNSYDNPNMKAKTLAQRSCKSKPHSKPEYHKVSILDDEGGEDELFKITDYCFSLDVLGLIFNM